MGLFRNADEPITAATVRSFDRIPTHAQTSLIDTDLWQIYRCVPEVHYAVNQQARLVGRLDWRVSVNGDDVADSDELMRQAFGSDLRGIATYMAVHLQVAGQFYLMRTPGGPGKGARWRVIRSPLPHDQRKVAEAANAAVQTIIEDPALETRADSPVMAVRDIATELMLTRAQARATARNRTAQLLTVLYPKEGAGPDPKKFEQQIAKVMTDPLTDEKSASVAVPNLIAWPQQYIDGWKTLDFTGPIDEKLHERVDRLIRQLTVGLDITPSLLLGLEDSTHWTAWASQEDNWLGHVEPLAAPIGQTMAAAIAMVTNTDPDAIEITPDPAPLLKRRPAIADVLTAWQAGLVSDTWAREQLGAPDTEAGPGLQVTAGNDMTDDGREANGEPVIEASERRQITAGSNAGRTAPTTAAIGAQGVEIDGRRLAEIDEQAYASFQDLVQDIADRVLEKLGARVRSLLQGRPGVGGVSNLSNIELARTYDGEIPNAEATLTQTVQDALTQVLRIITRAQGRVRAMGVEIPTSTAEDPRVIGAGEAFLAAVVGVVAAIRGGGTGTAEASMAARQIATIAGGGEASDFGGAVSGIALAASTMEVLRRDHLLVPATGQEGGTLYRWLHLYQGLHPHPVHLSLKDALVEQIPVFAGGYLAFPGDHAGCECVAAPAELVRVDTGWSQLQPSIGA
jgi:hypothetical protein